jgi:hypothetical protein
MKQTTKSNSRTRIGLGLIGLIIVLGLAGFIAYRALQGRGLGLRSLPRNIISAARAVADRQTVTQYNQGKFTNIIFLHHSTGENLILQGGVRERFTEAGYNFWDHSYNAQGLRDPAGKYTGYSYIVPGDNTDPDGMARIFSQRAYDLPINTLSGLLQHEVIIIKSCFAPANNIKSDQQLETYKSWYLGIRNTMDRHPDKVFVFVTFPPLNPAETNREEATRARAFADWLKSEEFLNGHPNIFTFDLFGKLAEENPAAPDFNMLRQSYRNGSDSHPNQLANETIGPLLVDFVIKAIGQYQEV